MANPSLRRIVGVLVLFAPPGCAQPQRDPVAVEPWFPTLDEKGDPVFAVFEGRIPCNSPELIGCDKVKVSLVLYKDVRSNVPTNYKLARVYVATSPQGNRLVASGLLSVTRGTTLDPSATVYRLDANAPPEFRAHWAIGTDILFMLDERLNLKVGTAGWSYVLNRTH